MLKHMHDNNPLFQNPLFKPMQKGFEFMIGFSPMAPFFGVKWAFADYFNPVEVFTPTTQDQNAPAPVKKAAPAKPKVTPKKATRGQNRFETDGSFSSRKEAEKEKTVKPKAKPAKQAEPVAFDFEEARNTITASIDPAVNINKNPAPQQDNKDAPTQTSDIGKPNNLLTNAPRNTDDLKMIKGVGPKLEILLNKLGIHKFEQFINYTPKELQWIDDNLTAFKGRALRDDWVEQARALMASQSPKAAKTP